VPPAEPTVWRRLQRGWPPSFPLVQFPNAPLALALAGALTARLADGRAHDLGRAAFFVAGGAWAGDEIAHGDNWFRRLLGAGALVYLIVGAANALS
jgi:hypothetical protein